MLAVDKYQKFIGNQMGACNPAVPCSAAGHWHGVPGTVTYFVCPGTVLMDGLPPLHMGDYWSEHYVPEWECSHSTFVCTGAPIVLCDGRPVAATGLSLVGCGVVVGSPVQNVVIVP